MTTSNPPASDIDNPKLDNHAADKTPVTLNNIDTLKNTEFFQHNPNDTKSHLLATGYQLLAQKGFTAVGIKKILDSAGVPKGSFYHYFASKEAFGEAIIQSYFEHYKHRLNAISTQDISAQQKLSHYFRYWYNTQQNECDHEKCLVVKLSGEVSDISDPMREALEKGSQQTIQWISEQVKAGWAEDSIPMTTNITPESIAKRWYYTWLGASLIAKTSRCNTALDEVWQMTASEIGLDETP